MISLYNKTKWYTDPKDELFDFGKHCNGLGQSGVFGFEKQQINDPGQRRWLEEQKTKRKMTKKKKI